MKLLQKDEHGIFYLASWSRGYIQPIEQYSQFAKWRMYNWLTFEFIRVEFEISRVLGTHLEIYVVILGLGFLFFQPGDPDIETP